MEIVSKLIEIEADLPINSSFIETKLKEMEINPLRWAIVKIENNLITVNLACEM